jgi:NifU-like protein involved in Fe-S cluster formation
MNVAQAASEPSVAYYSKDGYNVLCGDKVNIYVKIKTKVKEEQIAAVVRQKENSSVIKLDLYGDDSGVAGVFDGGKIANKGDGRVSIDPNSIEISISSSFSCSQNCGNCDPKNCVCAGTTFTPCGADAMVTVVTPSTSSQCSSSSSSFDGSSTATNRGNASLVGPLVTESPVIEEISFDGSGCAISQASASFMTDLLKVFSFFFILRFFGASQNN